MKNLKTEKQKIAAITKLAKKKSQLPITDHLRFDDKTITAHSLDTVVMVENPFKTKGRGTIDAVDFKKIHDSAVIEGIYFENDRAIVETNNGEFEFESYLFEDFPNIPEGLDQVGSIELDDKFKIAEQYVASDDMRPVMQCVYIDKEKEHIVSTDAHRLYFEPIDVSNLHQSILIHSNAFDFLQFGINSVRADGTWTKLSNNGIDVYARGDGKYPQWQAVIPEHPNSFTVDKKQFEKQNKLALITANSTTNQLEISEGAKQIQSQDLDYNKTYSSDLNATVEGEPVRIGYNGKFMLEVLKNCDNDITVRTGEPNRAIIINGKFLIMPAMLDH